MADNLPIISYTDDPANPRAIYFESPTSEKLYIPATDNDWSDFSTERDESRGLTREVSVSRVTLNNGEQVYVVRDANGKIITNRDSNGNAVGYPVLGRAGVDADRKKAWDEEERVRRQNQATEAKTIKDVSTVQVGGKWVKRTTYADNSTKDEEVSPEVRITTTEIDGKIYQIQTTTTPSGTTTAFTDLSTGQPIAALPVSQSQKQKSQTVIQKGADGRYYGIEIGPDGKMVGNPRVIAELGQDQKPGHIAEVKRPDGTSVLVRIDENGNAREVYRGEAAPAPPASSGNFVPDPRKPAMGLGEYVQQLAQLRAKGQLTDKQYEDLKTSAYNIALAEAKRLDTLVTTQRGAVQDQITQRANDLQAAQGRLTYAGQATQSAYNTAIEIAKSVHPKAMKNAPGGTILGSIMAVQDARAAQSGAYFQPPQVGPTPGTAYAEIAGWGANAGVRSPAPAFTPTPPATPTPPPVPPGPATSIDASDPAQQGRPAFSPPPPVAAATGMDASDPAQQGQPVVASPPTPAPPTPVPGGSGSAPGDAQPPAPATAAPAAPATPPSTAPVGGTPVFPPGGVVLPDGSRAYPDGSIYRPDGTMEVGPQAGANTDPYVTKRHREQGHEITMRQSEWDQAVRPEDADQWEAVPSSIPGPDVTPGGASLQPPATTPTREVWVREKLHGGGFGSWVRRDRAWWDRQDEAYKQRHEVQDAPDPDPVSPLPPGEMTKMPLGDGGGYSQPSLQADAVNTLAQRYGHLLPGSGVTPAPPAGSWFTPGAPSPAPSADAAALEADKQRAAAWAGDTSVGTPYPSSSWFRPTGAAPISMVPPVPAASAMVNPQVARLTQRYANDPEMLEALSLALSWG